MGEELKPCPFCGEHAVFHAVTRGYGIYVSCAECPGQMFSIDESDLLNVHAQEEAAIKLWNRRVADDA